MSDFFEQLEAAKRPHVTQYPWMQTKVFKLVTEQTLTQVINDCINSGLFAIDLETSGLDNRVFDGRTNDYIVGFCLSPDGEHGYYIPVRHKDSPANLRVSVVEKEIKRLLDSPAVAIFHNAKFDQEFLQWSGNLEPMGEFDNPMKWEDTIILTYLRDTATKNKGLKHLSKTMLDMEMIELIDLFTNEEFAATGKNFSVLDPMWEPALWYAASDAICTYLLYKKIVHEALDAICPNGEPVPSQNTVYLIEKMALLSTRWMERNQIPISRPKVAELIRVAQREWLPALVAVYTETSKSLGRDITPGYFRLLTTPGSGFTFDPEEVDGLSLMEQVDRARAHAVSKNMDKMEPDNKGKMKVATIPKSVPKLVDPKHPKYKTESKLSEMAEFPVVYDVLIPDQLGLLMRELGVEGLVPTAAENSTKVKTSKDVMDNLFEEIGEQYHSLVKVKRFR